MTSVSLRLRSASACLSITVFLLSVLAGPAPVSAQVLYGSLVGNVVDESGAALPGATVTVTTGGRAPRAKRLRIARARSVSSPCSPAPTP